MDIYKAFLTFTFNLQCQINSFNVDTSQNAPFNMLYDNELDYFACNVLQSGLVLVVFIFLFDILHSCKYF